MKIRKKFTEYSILSQVAIGTLNRLYGGRTVSAGLQRFVFDPILIDGAKFLRLNEISQFEELLTTQILGKKKIMEITFHLSKDDIKQAAYLSCANVVDGDISANKEMMNIQLLFGEHSDELHTIARIIQYATEEWWEKYMVEFEKRNPKPLTPKLD